MSLRADPRPASGSPQPVLSLTIVLLHFCIITLLHYCIIVLLHYCINVLLHYYIIALLCYFIIVLLHYCIIALLYYCIIVLLHYYIIALSYHCIIVLLRYCIVALPVRYAGSERERERSGSGSDRMPCAPAFSTIRSHRQNAKFITVKQAGLSHGTSRTAHPISFSTHRFPLTAVRARDRRGRSSKDKARLQCEDRPAHGGGGAHPTDPKHS
jgi:hypothetical protein